MMLADACAGEMHAGTVVFGLGYLRCDFRAPVGGLVIRRTWDIGDIPPQVRNARIISKDVNNESTSTWVRSRVL